jgi:hypothetical protein
VRALGRWCEACLGRGRTGLNKIKMFFFDETLLLYPIRGMQGFLAV